METICEVWYDEIDILGLFAKANISDTIYSVNELFKDIAFMICSV